MVSTLGMNCYRMIQGYVEHADVPGGAVAYLGNLASWDHVFKDVLYATQEIFGDAVGVRCISALAYSGFLRHLQGAIPRAQIYRCWIIWNRDWRVIVLPVMLWIASTGKSFEFTFDCGIE